MEKERASWEAEETYHLKGVTVQTDTEEKRERDRVRERKRERERERERREKESGGDEICDIRVTSENCMAHEREIRRKRELES
jgi:hypothetical protein